MSDDKTGWRKLLSVVVSGARYVLLVALPAAVAVFGALAGGTQESTARTNLLYATGLSAVLLAGVNILKDLQAQKAGNSAEKIVHSLHESTQPLLTLLGRVANASPSERKIHINTLVARVVGIAKAQSGSFASKESNRRAVYYHFVDENRLSRQYSEGRDNPKPRPEFIARDGKSIAEGNDRKVVEIAKGEDSILIRDVDKAPPDYFSDYKGRPYKTFLMVPVRTEERSYGFLSVDADRANTLTRIDLEYAIVLARILATGLSLLGEDFPKLGGYTAPAPRQVSQESTKGRN